MTGEDAPIEPVRWGVLSTAHINEKVLRGAARTPLADVQAVASRDSVKARDFATRWSIPRSYDDYDAVLDDPDVEAVYIPLPNKLHHAWTLRALDAGKHVLCEKPYSRRPIEIVEAFDLAASRDLVLSEGFMFRYNPQVEQVVEIVRQGTIGPLRLISASFSWPTGGSDDIRMRADLDGGSLMDVGCYCVSAARLLAGEPTSVAADSVIGPSGVDVQMAGLLRFDAAASDGGAVQAVFDTGFNLPDRSLLEVVGDRGSIRVRNPWHCYTPGLEIELQGSAPVSQTPPIADSYELQFEAFARAVRGLDSPLLGRSDAFGQAATIDALYRSAATGRTITIPTLDRVRADRPD